MFKAIKKFFFGKPAEQTSTQTAPYKVEPPTSAPTVVVDASLDNKPQVVAAPVATAPAVKKSTAPRAKKPVVKKPTAPRMP